MTHDGDALRTRRRFRPNPFAVVAALLGAAAFAAALALKSVQVGRAPADYYGMLSWLAPEIGLAPLAALLGLVAVILATGARDLCSAVIGLLGCGLATAGLVIALTHAPPNAMDLNRRCSRNVKTIATALTMYEADHGALPPAANWTQALGEYVHDHAVWMEPLTGRPGYALNAAIAGRRSGSFAADSARMVAVFESDRGANAAGGPELLPRRPRHYGGDYFAFADGGVRLVFGLYQKDEQFPPSASLMEERGLTWNPHAPPAMTPGADQRARGR